MNLITNKYIIREQNEAAILQEIINRGQISRAELSTQTGLNKASVSSITKKLIEDELIFEIGIGDSSSSGGRKPIMLAFNGKSALVIAFDLGTNYLEGVLAYIDGTIVETYSKERISIGSTNASEEINLAFTQLTLKQPDTPLDIVGMTVAIHGVVNRHQPIFTPHYDLDKIDLYKELKANYSFPIHLYNEANLAALGEYTFSSEYQNLVTVSIHSGIGSGIVESGEMFLGKNGQAGEIGHTILFPNGKQCSCGNRGCFEQYASSNVIYDKLAKQKQLEYVNSSIFLEYVSKNDKEAQALIQGNAEFLSIGINNIIMMYNPEIIIINSSLCRAIPQMIEIINQYLKSQFSREIEVKNTLLGDYATLYGGVSVSCQEFLRVKGLKFKEK
ncbi:MAG: ROK family transcriptional regulator [Micrococcaceae bacterium]